MMTAAPLSPNAWMRWDLIRRELRGDAPNTSVLEVGMGQGALGTRLELTHRYTGVEPDELSRATARRRLRTESRVLTDVEDLDPSEQFDIVCAFEVLEHIDDDAYALRAWAAHLRPGGRLMLSVPAHSKRYAAADELVGHLRRYERAELEQLLDEAGLHVERIDGTGFGLGYVLEWGRNRLAARRLASRRAPSNVAERSATSGRTFQPPPWAGVLTEAGTVPFRWLQRPFRRSELATGWFAIARRPSA